MPHSTVSNTTINGQQVDVASLETISFRQLASKQPDAVDRLLSACQMPGFFYLDLQDERTEDMLAVLRKVYAVSEKHFKPSEQQSMVEIKRDNMIEASNTFPETLTDHAKLLEEFSTLCHSVNKTMLICLSDALQLDGASRFENSHRDDKPSDTALNLIYSPAKRKRADAPDTTHTDTGTLTSLFCDEWGIMIEHPETKAWAFVEPKPGCALVNVADSLQSLSGNRLYSCRHCHTQPVDGFLRRYFVVSYLRPEKAP